MLIATDTETTGLAIRHGCRPFFISTWAEEGEYGSPSEFENFLGYSKNFEFPMNPTTRTPILSEKTINEVEKYFTGHDIVFFNAPYDLLAFASIGIYFDFESVGGKPWCTTDLRNSSRFPETLPEPVVLIKCGECHDAAVLAHARNNKQPRPPAKLKPTATYYLDLSNQDEEELKEGVKALKHYVKNNHSDYTEGKDAKGEAVIETDYWLPKHYFPESPESQLCDRYASLDAYRTLALFVVLSNYAPPGVLSSSQADRGWESYMRQMSVLPATCVMSSQGLYLDEDALSFNENSLFQRLKDATDIKKKALTDFAIEYTGDHNINVGSSKQLGLFLYAPKPYGLGLPVLDVTGAKKPGTGAPVLKKLINYVTNRIAGTEYLLPHKRDSNLDLLSRDYSKGSMCYEQVDLENARWVLDQLTTYEEKEGFDKDNTGYKTYETGIKYLNGYLANAYPVGHPNPIQDWLPEKVKPFRERWLDYEKVIFPSFNLVGITLTRFSSQNPNAQNVSKKPEIPLRTAFRPQKGKVFVSIDYSQLELRIFAGASKDPQLIEAFAQGYDFHEFTACGMYGYKMGDEIPSHLRRIAKNVNFGIVYGAGAPKIAATSGDPEAYNKYSTQFPNAKAYMDKTMNKVRNTGCVQTLFGYNLHVYPDPPHKGVNYIVQGTAGELVKAAMVDIFYSEDSPLDWDRCRMVINVHDELIFELDDDPDYIKKVAPLLGSIMERQGDKIEVQTPVSIDVHTKNWKDSIPFEEYCLASQKRSTMYSENYDKGFTKA